MPEPEFEIIQDTCFGYHYANPNGIGVKISHLSSQADEGYLIEVTHIDLTKGEVTFKYTDLKYNSYINEVNQYINSIRSYTGISLPKLPSHRGTIVKKEVDLLKNRDIVYLDTDVYIKEVHITDDTRGIEYANAPIFITLITCNVNQDTGIDIISGSSAIVSLEGENKNLRLAHQDGLTVMWRSSEFPYKNMTVDKTRGTRFYNVPGLEPVKATPHFVLLTPSISQVQRYLKVSNDLSLGSYVSVNFNHSDTDFPGDQKHILVVSYDGDNTGKATPFFDLNSLSYKKGYIYRDVDLSKVQLDPQLVAKSKKITLYAFNGQTPFASVGELAVK